VNIPIVAISSVLLRTGEVLMFAYPYRPHVLNPETGEDSGPDPNRADAYLFNPVTGQSTQVTPPIDPNTGQPANLFCAGASLLPDGRVLVAGGNIGDPTAAENQGLDTLYTFDPATRTWAYHGRTRQGRWYPSQLEMADGRTVLIAGRPQFDDPDWAKRVNSDVEIFSPDNTLQRLRNFRVDKEDDDPVRPGHAPLPGQYPHMFWMPGGHALVAGPRKTDTWRFHPPTAGADDARWEDVANLPTHREWASGVLLPGSARVILFGGADKDDHYAGPPSAFPAVASTTLFDDSKPAAGWTTGPNMKVARAFSNSVLLPDGKVALVGGGTGEDSRRQYYRWELTPEHKRIEIYDPATGGFTLGNAQAEGRTYHSTALLLPDGRVLSAGDDINGSTGPGTGARTDTAEIWSPPYLFNADGTAADRPQLLSAPQTIEYGQPFTAGAAGDIQRAVLIAPGSTTHNTDMSQRAVPLAEPGHIEDAVELMAPARADLAPPGYYMLFLINPQGVPSTARFVRLAEAPKPTPSPTPQPTTSPSPEPTATPRAFGVAVRARAPRLRTLRRTGRIRVRVALTGAGRVRLILARDDRGRRRAVMLPRTVEFREAGARVLRLRLSAAGRRRVARGRTVRLRLTASATPLDGPAKRARQTLRVR